MYIVKYQRYEFDSPKIFKNKYNNCVVYFNKYDSALKIKNWFENLLYYSVFIEIIKESESDYI